MRRRRQVRGVGLVAVATLCAALVSCGTGSPDGGDGTGEVGVDAAQRPVDATAPREPDDDRGEREGADRPADPEHAVDPPGPRRRDEAIAPPDMMVFDAAEPLGDRVVRRIKGLRGVTDVARFSLAQVPLQNRIYDLAVVDAATYRLFTPPQSADFQRQWDRVAGGEVSLAPGLQDELPIDDDGFLRLDHDGAESIHVGVVDAPQVERVDVVVNTAWGEELGVPRGNALLLRTGLTSPQSLRPRIERIVGDSATIQDMDVVARTGLDPEATQTAFTIGPASEAVGTYRYTVLGGGRIAPEQAWIEEHIATEDVPILGSVTCNKAMLPQLRAALAEVAARGLADEIDPGQYAGCYYPRFIAGSTSLSNHSFGTALDLNVAGNQRGSIGEIDRDVVDIFKKWGFAWGGDWTYTDPMHFELDRIVDPR